MNVSRARILVVDDVPANVKVLGHALRADYDVAVAMGGADALRIAQSSPPPDLVLLDITMPGMDGYEVCQRLKADVRTASIPVIFVTACDDEAEETRGLSIGAVDYITRPFSVPIVLARVRTHVELKRSRDQLERMSSLDGLTGVANRRRFDETLARELARERAVAEPLSVAMIDIDHFKMYNDHYGHLAGDDCIRAVATALAGSLPKQTDLLARYGGEEFVALLPGVGAAEAARAAEAMRAELGALALPHARSPVAPFVTVSVGVATLRTCCEKAHASLLQQADVCLYRAKEQGRDRVVAAENAGSGWLLRGPAVCAPAVSPCAGAHA